jgi:predicted RNase H-like HicB family nuclease
MKYVVVYEPTPNGWSAYAPDLPGCIAAGDTREEVQQLMREAISLHIEALREQGQPVPQPGAWTGLVEVPA